jgi:ribosomal protein S18 acetylase RimI-like enzyme
MSFITRQYTLASDFLSACAASLIKTRAAAGNLPLASSYALAAPGASPDKFGPAEDNIWISIISSGSGLSSTVAGQPVQEFESSSSDSRTNYAFALIIVGPFPGVLLSSHNPSSVPSTILTEVTSVIISKLKELKIPPTRLQSIFGPSLLTAPFSTSWATLHSMTVKPKPLLDAQLCILSRSTLTSPTRPLPNGVTLGKAVIEELDLLARMYHDFTNIGPHPSDLPASRTRVEGMVKGGQLIVARQSLGLDGIATPQAIVAIIRSTPGVKAISMVWTEPVARGTGLAEALVRHVCTQTLEENHSEYGVDVEQICLFVEPSNPAAVKVYGRVGFSPLSESEHWTEYGWEGVQLKEFS